MELGRDAHTLLHKLGGADFSTSRLIWLNTSCCPLHNISVGTTKKEVGLAIKLWQNVFLSFDWLIFILHILQKPFQRSSAPERLPIIYSTWENEREKRYTETETESSGNKHICLAKFSRDEQYTLPFEQYPFYVFTGNDHEKEKIGHISFAYFYFF